MLRDRLNWNGFECKSEVGKMRAIWIALFILEASCASRFVAKWLVQYIEKKCDSCRYIDPLFRADKCHLPVTKQIYRGYSGIWDGMLWLPMDLPLGLLRWCDFELDGTATYLRKQETLKAHFVHLWWADWFTPIWFIFPSTESCRW